MEWFKNLEVVLTGGAGFIGSHLVEKLLASGAKVTVIDNFLCGNKIEHLRGHKNLVVYQGDTRDAEIVSYAFKDKDVVFHLASIVGVEETQLQPTEVLNVGVWGLSTVLNAAVDNRIKRIVFGSSSEVYGDSPKPMKEDGPLSPKSLYAHVKLAGEEEFAAFYRKHGLEFTVVRYFNVYGPGQDERFAVPHFVNRVLSNKPLLIYGDGEQTRDFTYIDDAVSMTLLAATKPEASCQTINIGTGIRTRLNQVARLIAKILDGKYPTELEHVHYSLKRPLAVEVFSRVADISKGRRLLQYEPQISLEQGIRKYVDWWLGR